MCVCVCVHLYTFHALFQILLSFFLFCFFYTLSKILHYDWSVATLVMVWKTNSDDDFTEFTLFFFLIQMIIILKKPSTLH